MELTISEPEDQFDPGVYEAAFIRVEEGPDSEFGSTLRWTFFLLDPDPGDDDSPWVERSYLTSRSTGPRSKAFKITSALLGRKPESGEKIDYNHLNSVRVKLALTVNDAGWNRIGDAYPAGNAPAANRPAVDPVPANAEGFDQLVGGTASVRDIQSAVKGAKTPPPLPTPSPATDEIPF